MRAEPRRAGSPLRVVIDTNVWISAALSPSGAAAKVVHRVLEKGLPVFSSATFAELETRLWKPKFDLYLSLEIRRRILHDLNAAAIWVEPHESIAVEKYCRDPDDDKFIHTALSAQARWLVSGDQDLIETPPLANLRILLPSEALNLPDFLVDPPPPSPILP